MSKINGACLPGDDDLFVEFIFTDDVAFGNDQWYKTQFESSVRQTRFDVMKVGSRVDAAAEELREALSPGNQFVRLEIGATRGFDKLGLKWTIDEREGLPRLSGDPKRPYDGSLWIRCETRRDGKSDGDDVYARKDFKIVGENIDSWELWEDNPPPKDDPYQCENEQTLSGEINPKIAVIGASLRGRSHAHRGMFRDDCMAVRLAEERDEPGWSALVVSDGAGSAVFSREGARIVCETLANNLAGELNKSVNFDFLKDKIERFEKTRRNESRKILSASPGEIEEFQLDKFFTRGVYEVYVKIKEESERRSRKVSERASTLNEQASARRNESQIQYRVRDYAATALAVATKRFKASKDRPPFWAIASYWIGDGAAAIWRPNGEDRVLPLGRPDSGEYAGETRFITSREEADQKTARARVRLTIVDRFEGIVLATDGVTDPFFPSDASLERFDDWKSFWDVKLRRGAPGAFEAARPLDERAKELLEWLRFKEKGYHDDRTILLALDDDLRKEKGLGEFGMREVKTRL